jgi:hypothetical protein
VFVCDLGACVCPHRVFGVHVFAELWVYFLNSTFVIDYVCVFPCLYTCLFSVHLSSLLRFCVDEIVDMCIFLHVFV